MQDMVIELKSISNTELSYNVNYDGKKALFKMKKVTDNGGDNGGGNSDVSTALLIGSWETTLISGSATDIATGNIVESWNNDTPDATDKKYMVFSFLQNGKLEILSHGEDDAEQEGFVTISGTWTLDGNKCHVVTDEMDFVVDIVTLNNQNLTFHYSLVKPFRPRHSDQEYTVTYDETIYLKRLLIG